MLQLLSFYSTYFTNLNNFQQPKINPQAYELVVSGCLCWCDNVRTGGKTVEMFPQVAQHPATTCPGWELHSSQPLTQIIPPSFVTDLNLYFMFPPFTSC